MHVLMSVDEVWRETGLAEIDRVDGDLRGDLTPVDTPGHEPTEKPIQLGSCRPGRARASVKRTSESEVRCRPTAAWSGAHDGLRVGRPMGGVTIALVADSLPSCARDRIPSETPRLIAKSSAQSMNAPSTYAKLMLCFALGGALFTRIPISWLTMYRGRLSPLHRCAQDIRQSRLARRANPAKNMMDTISDGNREIGVEQQGIDDKVGRIGKRAKEIRAPK